MELDCAVGVYIFDPATPAYESSSALCRESSPSPLTLSELEDEYNTIIVAAMASFAIACHDIPTQTA